ncbi:MAG: SlyX family protein [Planctomycetota bacterium]|nr:SlyX family protein [Planctomycetota bacterium]
MPNQTDASRIEALEISIAHQQRLLEQLNEVVTEHSKILIQLEKAIPKLREELLELRAAQDANSSPLANEKPPHY